jgi:hypothetical protein
MIGEITHWNKYARCTHPEQHLRMERMEHSGTHRMIPLALSRKTPIEI